MPETSYFNSYTRPEEFVREYSQRVEKRHRPRKGASLRQVRQNDNGDLGRGFGWFCRYKHTILQFGSRSVP